MKHVVTFVLLCLGGNCLRAQPGTLDTTFGTGGKVVTHFAGIQNEGRGAVLQADGKIVVAGMVYTPDYDVALCRFNDDGSPDVTFGVGGKVVTGFGGADQEGKAIALQPDGKILVAGFTYDIPNAAFDFLLLRYNTNGSLDTAFGDSGRVLTFFDGDAVPNAIAVQSDGCILLSGTSQYLLGDQDFGLCRYLPDGRRDSSFGINGIVRTDFEAGSEDNPYAMQLTTDGKILVGGETRPATSIFYDFGLVRYNSNGSVDSAFGINGRVVTNMGDRRDAIKAIRVRSDGKIVVAGDVGTDFTVDYGLCRYTPSGTIDSTFGINGKVSSTGSYARCMALQADGGMLIGGGTSVGAGDNILALVRHREDGVIDSAFGTDGRVYTGVTNGDMGNAVFTDHFGRIVLAGTGVDSMIVVRYHSAMPSSVGSVAAAPAVVSLFPNPAKGSCTISFPVHAAVPVHISLLSADGSTIATLYKGNVPAGQFNEQLMLPEVATGIYWISTIAGQSAYITPIKL